MITIINGGTQGLGEAVARRLIERSGGEPVGLVLAGRSADRGQALAAELSRPAGEGESGGGAAVDAIFVQADMTDPEAPGTIVEAAMERFGRIDGLVNVAAATSRANLFDDTPEHFDLQMTVNVKAPYFLIQAVARTMVDQKIPGSIVNIGSTSGYGGQPKLAAYCMSKGALAIMTRNLAYALMRHGIRVNQVNPGWMETESEHHTQMTHDGAPENWLELAAPTRPFGRLVQPWEVANTIVHCLGPESGLLTGNLIDVDQSVLGAGDPPIPTADETVWP